MKKSCNDVRQQIEHVMALAERMSREVDTLLDMWCGVMRDFQKTNDPDPERGLENEDRK